MFLFEYARRKSFLSVVFKDRNHLLPNDWATIQSFINKVNRAASPLDTMFKDLAVGVESGKRRQQTRMNIQNAVAVSSR